MSCSPDRAGLPTWRTLAAEVLRRRFLAILPAVERHGRVLFRRLRCRHRLQDALAEMTALAWRWFLRLAHKGKVRR